METVLFAVGTAAVRVLSFYAVSVAGMVLSLFFANENALFFAFSIFPVSLAFAGAAWGLIHPLLFIASLGLICWYVSTRSIDSSPPPNLSAASSSLFQSPIGSPSASLSSVRP
jgi:hypothetical protein